MDVLHAICESLLIPEAVYDEIMARKERPDAQAIADSRWIRVAAVKNQLAVTRLMKAAGLHVGESEAIVLARERKADRIILDDLAARRVASRRRMPVIGTLGLLLLAKTLHLIPSVQPTLTELIAAGRYVDPATYREVLTLAGEM